MSLESARLPSLRDKLEAEAVIVKAGDGKIDIEVETVDKKKALKKIKK